VALRDRLRGPASLLALSASYALRRPASALPALRVAIDVGMRVRRAPVLRARPELFTAEDDLLPVCSLVSDTHVCAAGESPVELPHDPGQWPWARQPDADDIAGGLVQVLADVRRRAPQTVIWCGDEVDTGSPAEWALLRAVIDSVPQLTHWMVPGNHDICFNRPFVEDHDLSRRAERERAYREHAARVAEFPIADTIIGDAGPVTIILLDSCRHASTHVLSNAIGRFGDDQLAALERMLAAARGPVLVVAHHHVWRDAQFDQPEAWFNTAVDADRLAALLRAYSQRARKNQVLVCHGHRHAMTAGTIGDGVSVVGLPSTTLGDKSVTGQLDGVLRYTVAGLRLDGTGWGVAVREVGRIVEDERSGSHAAPAHPPNAALRVLESVRRL
jgi:3',5'-cyclic AMP phosphodiesterase CpdA